MDDQEANKIIAEFMSDKKIPLFAASDDSGESAKFTNESRAVVQHFLDDDPNCYHVDCEVFDWSYYERRTNSLDALVPVWERLKCAPDFEWDWNPNQHKDMYWCELSEKYGMEKPYGYSCGDTIFQAAAMATCKAIMELSDGR